MNRKQCPPVCFEVPIGNLPGITVFFLFFCEVGLNWDPRTQARCPIALHLSFKFTGGYLGVQPPYRGPRFRSASLLLFVLDPSWQNSRSLCGCEVVLFRRCWYTIWWRIQILLVTNFFSELFGCSGIFCSNFSQHWFKIFSKFFQIFPKIYLQFWQFLVKSILQARDYCARVTYF